MASMSTPGGGASQKVSAKAVTVLLLNKDVAYMDTANEAEAREIDEEMDQVISSSITDKRKFAHVRAAAKKVAGIVINKYDDLLLNGDKGQVNNNFFCPTGFGTVYAHTRASELSFKDPSCKDPRSNFMDYLEVHLSDLSYGMSAVSIEGGAEDDEGEDEGQEVDEPERIAYVNGTRKPFAYIFETCCHMVHSVCAEIKEDEREAKRKAKEAAEKAERDEKKVADAKKAAETDDQLEILRAAVSASRVDSAETKLVMDKIQKYGQRTRRMVEKSQVDTARNGALIYANKKESLDHGLKTAVVANKAAKEAARRTEATEREWRTRCVAFNKSCPASFAMSPIDVSTTATKACNPTNLGVAFAQGEENYINGTPPPLGNGARTPQYPREGAF